MIMVRADSPPSLKPTAAARTFRLAYLTTEYPKASHTFIRREIVELERRGHRVMRLAIRDGRGAIADEADRNEAQKTTHCLAQPKWRFLVDTVHAAVTRPVQFLNAVKTAYSMHRRSDRGLIVHCAYIGEAAVLLRMLRQHDIEHVHVHFGTNAAAVARLIRLMGGPPYSMTVHGPTEFDASRGFSLREKVIDSAFTVAISQFCAAQLRRWVPYEHWHKIHIIHCSVGSKFFDDARPIHADSHTLVCVGRLTPQKGQHLLIQAMHRLVEEGIDARLILAGDGELRGELQRHIYRLGLNDNITITGWIDEATVRQHLHDARALVQPSFAEGLPVVIMEALAMGRPVISSMVAGVPELVRHNENGWLVSAGDVDSLADAMRDALKSPIARLNEMGAAGRQRVRQHHFTVTETTRLEGLFETYIQQRTHISADHLNLEAPSTNDVPDPLRRRYALITPCRDEAAFLQTTIDAVAAQSVPPAKWIIVDDGSTDNTPNILERAAMRYPFIQVIRRQNRGERAVGPGVVEAFYDGLAAIDLNDFDYVCKLDGDLDFAPRYFERLMELFESNQRLGTLSGKLFLKYGDRLVEERCGDENSVGPAKLYRVRCFQDIGGFVRQVSWDGIDGHMCRMKGWLARSLDDPHLQIIHLRRMGSSQKNFWTGRVRWGRGKYFMGSAWYYVLAVSMYRMFERPYVLSGAGIMWGYLKAWFTREPRFCNPEYLRFFRRFELQSLLMGKRRTMNRYHRAIQSRREVAANITEEACVPRKGEVETTIANGFRLDGSSTKGGRFDIASAQGRL